MRLKLASLILCGVLAASAFAADQPQWGEAWSRNMVSPEKNLADSFDPKTGRNVKWTTKLGTQTHSTPVVARGRVYIGTNNGQPRDPKHQGDRGVFMCFDEQTGRLRWQFVVPKRDEDAYMDWPRMGMSSPATVEDERVYLVDNRGAVVCLDARGMSNGNDGPFRDEAAYLTPSATHAKPRQEAGADTHPETLQPPPDGKLVQPGPMDADILWKFDLVAECGVWPHDAAHSSILLRGDQLYLNTGSGVDNTHRRVRAPNAPSLVVLDKNTGRLLGREDEHIARDVFHNTWAGPSLGTFNGRELIFFCGGNGVVYAFEPLAVSASRREPPNASLGENGRALEANLPTLKKVFQFDFDPAAATTSTPASPELLSEGGASPIDVHKFIGNRREGPSNLYGMPVFVNGRLYIAGGGDLWWGKNEAWLKCIDATGTGDITRTGLVWSYPLEKHVMSTAAVQDGLVYIADCGRRFHCVDAATGRPRWTHEIQGEAWASPCVADGKVYLGTRSGMFYVFAAGKEKKVLAELDLGEPISSTTTAANGVLYVATMSELLAIQKGTWQP